MDKLKKVIVKGLLEPVFINSDGTQIMYRGEWVNPYLVKSKLHTKGFLQCCIKNKRLYVHRLVAAAFIHNTHPVSYKLVLHRDTDTLHNYFKNLEWGNRALVMQNMQVAGRLGANVPQYRGSSSISYEDALSIAKRLDAGGRANSICIEYGVSEMSINRIRKRYCKNTQASPRYDKNVKEAVLRLLDVHTITEVATISGLSYNTVSRWNKKQKLCTI